MIETNTERCYEVHQRQTQKDIPAVIPPGFSLQSEFIADPYPMLARLRDNYSCFKDWYTNSYWVTRYDEVTSLIADEVNFTTRPRRSTYSTDLMGCDLRDEPLVRDAIGRGMQEHAESAAQETVYNFSPAGTDLIEGYVQPFTVRLLARIIGISDRQIGWFGDLWQTIQDGIGWHPGREDAGVRAMTELNELVSQLLSTHTSHTNQDLLSAAHASRADATNHEVARDITATLLELDSRTLEGSLANLFCLLLTHPNQLEILYEDPDLVMRAWQETVRHSPPLMESHLYAVREVERFGRLIPTGSLVICSAAAANRDPAIFDGPDLFNITRKDLAYREPRGQFRIDGLPAGVAPGLAPLSKMSARPANRPPSVYALTADAAVTAATVLLDSCKGFHLAGSDQPCIMGRWPGDSRICRRLVIELGDSID